MRGGKRFVIVARPRYHEVVSDALWLVALVRGLRTLDEVKEKLGRPDAVGSRTTTAPDGRTITRPMAVYMNISSSTYLQIIERGAGAPVQALAHPKEPSDRGALVLRRPARDPSSN